MSFDALFDPLEAVDAWLAGLLAGAPLAVSLGIAFVLGLRHASDPDHLVAVTSLVAAEDGDVRAAARLGAWWGAGHAATLLAIGLPLIALKSQLPGWLERGAEAGIGLIILALAVRVLVKWMRGEYAVGPHVHHGVPGDHHGEPGDHRHVREGAGAAHAHRDLRTPQQAFAIGTLHGLAGTGAIVVLLITALPAQGTALAALLLFAPMSVLSMAAMTAAFAWFFTRPLMDPLFRRVLMPLMGTLGLLFGAWYAGLA
jgi:hypothetical protein